MTQEFPVISPEFKERVESFKRSWAETYKKISEEDTPRIDGNGQKIIDKRPDGYDYIIESYMRGCLDKHFPGWSWESAAPLEFVGTIWVVAQGHLCIVDECLIPFGVSPPVRKFYGVDSVRIQYKSGLEKIPSNIVDLGDNCKQANSAALKYAINRLTHIGDDVYGKRIEEEGAGSYEDVFISKPDAMNFSSLVAQRHWRWDWIFKTLGIGSVGEIKDFEEAYTKLQDAAKEGR
jgi:hypothetical protein